MTIPHTLHRPTGPPRPCVEQDPEWSAVRPCGCGGGFPPGEAFGPSRERPGPETHERPDPPGWSPEPEWLPLRNPCLPVGCGPPGGHGQGNLREEPSSRPSRPSPSGQRCPGSDQAMKPDAPPWPDCSTHGFGGAPPPVHPPGCGPGLSGQALRHGQAANGSRRRFGRPLIPDGLPRNPCKDGTGGPPVCLSYNRTFPDGGRARGDPPLALRKHPNGQGAPPGIADPPGEASTRCPPGPDWVPLGPSVPASMRDGGGSRTHAPPGAPFHSQQRKPGSRAPTSTRTRGQDAAGATNLSRRIISCH